VSEAGDGRNLLRSARDHGTNFSQEVSSTGDAAPPEEGQWKLNESSTRKRPELGWKYGSSLAAPHRSYALGDPGDEHELAARPAKCIEPLASEISSILRNARRQMHGSQNGSANHIFLHEGSDAILVYSSHGQGLCGFSESPHCSIYFEPYRIQRSHTGMDFLCCRGGHGRSVDGDSN
jgi:hypothetical protein